MKRIDGTKACYGFSLLLLAGFLVHTMVDYGRYSSTLNSAPFSVWVLVNMLCFLVPAILVFVIGLVLKKRRKQDEKNKY